VASSRSGGENTLSRNNNGRRKQTPRFQICSLSWFLIRDEVKVGGYSGRLIQKYIEL
jgi:hypothetical protein